MLSLLKLIYIGYINYTRMVYYIVLHTVHRTIGERDTEYPNRCLQSCMCVAGEATCTAVATVCVLMQDQAVVEC